MEERAIQGIWYEARVTRNDEDPKYEWAVRVAGTDDHTGKTATVFNKNGGKQVVTLVALLKFDQIGAAQFGVYSFKKHASKAPDEADFSKLEPMVWNRPDKPYHGKPIYADHWTKKGFTHHEKFKALPKEDQRAKLYKCRDCRQMVAVAKSPKTGKMVVCKAEKVQHSYQVYRGKRAFTKPELYFYPFVAHECDARQT